MKTVAISALTMMASLTSTPVSAQLPWAQKTPQAVYILVSNNLGFAPEKEDQLLIRKAAYETMQKEIREARGGGNKKRVIKIILTTNSTNVLFSGTGKQLESEGGRIAEAIETFQPNCNDLVRSFSNIENDVNSAGYKRIRIVLIGRFVHVPAPCDNAQVIPVPQDLPDTLPLAKILKSVRYAEFTALAVHPNQYAPVWAYFEENRLSNKKHIKLEVLRIDETGTRVGFTWVDQAAEDVSAGGNP